MGVKIVRALDIAMVVLAAPLAGQELEDLRILETEGRELLLGTEVTGTLSAQSVVWATGTFVQAWALRLQQGQNVTIDLLSDDFDAFLMVGGPGMSEILADDDGAGACHARVQLSATTAGVYRVVASTVPPGARGDYRIRATAEPGSTTQGECTATSTFSDEQIAWLRALPTDGRSLTVGAEVPGILSEADSISWDGTFVQAWKLTVPQHGSVYIDLLSDDFDAFLVVLRPDQRQPLFDDDAAGACNARVLLEDVPDGNYTVIANSVAESTGRFRLRASSEPLPQLDGECSTGLTDWLVALPTEGRELELDREHSGMLSQSDHLGGDGTFAQAWNLVVTGSPSFTIDLLSDDFDAFLFVLTPEGVVFRDNDGAGACNARVQIDAPPPGSYRVVANTRLPDEVGAFLLRAAEVPVPKTDGPCGEAGLP